MAGAMATGLGGSQRVSKMRRLTDNKVSWFHKADNQGSKAMQSAGSRLEGDKNRVLDDTSSPKRVGFDPRPVPV